MSELTQTITIINKLGLHARAAAKLVMVASRFESDISICFRGKKANAKSIMAVMMLAASKGSEVKFTLTGDDASDAFNAISQLVNNLFGEEE